MIYSKHRHDYVTCGCGACSIDGGSDYMKISGDPGDWEIVQGVKREEKRNEKPVVKNSKKRGCPSKKS